MNTPGTSTNHYPMDQTRRSTFNNANTENYWPEAPVLSSSRVHRKPFAPMNMNRSDDYPRYVHKGHESTRFHEFSGRSSHTPVQVHSEANYGQSIERDLMDNAWNDDYTDQYNHMNPHNQNTDSTAPNGQFYCDQVPMTQHHYVGYDEDGYVEEELPVYQEWNSGDQPDVFENTPYKAYDTVNSVVPSTNNPTTVSSFAASSQNYSKKELDDLLNAEVGEDIDTINLCRSISMELKDNFIPQHVFAERILNRKQGTLSDILRHPKQWNTLKSSGRLVYRRMYNWMSQPLEMRLAILDMKGDEESVESTESSRPFPTQKEQRQRKSTMEEPAPKRRRMTFTEYQKSSLQSIFEEEQRPTTEFQQQIADNLGLDLSQVHNFFMNSRRRFGRNDTRANRRKQNHQQVTMDVEGNYFEEEYEQ